MKNLKKFACLSLFLFVTLTIISETQAQTQTSVQPVEEGQTIKSLLREV